MTKTVKMTKDLLKVQAQSGENFPSDVELIHQRPFRKHKGYSWLAGDLGDNTTLRVTDLHFIAHGLKVKKVILDPSVPVLSKFSEPRLARFIDCEIDIIDAKNIDSIELENCSTKTLNTENIKKITVKNNDLLTGINSKNISWLEKGYKKSRDLSEMFVENNQKLVLTAEQLAISTATQEKEVYKKRRQTRFEAQVTNTNNGPV